MSPLNTPLTVLKPLAALAVLLPVLSACTSVPSGSAQALEPTWVAQARDAALSVPPKLVGRLTSVISQSGPAEAIRVCQEEAPKMAQAASEKTGWQIRRVSLKNRNPKAVPDAWEQDTLALFDRQQAQGTDPAELERWTVSTENGTTVRRYMKALPTASLCIQCHGSADKLGPGVAERLGALYPQDKATGYTVGQIRGAMTLKQVVKP